MRIRPATVEDARRLAEITHAGFLTYVPFAPDTYTPPTVESESALLAEAIAEPDYFARVAEDDHGLAGLVSFFRREVEPGRVYFQRLFVHERAWGSGIAGQLMDLAVAEMRRSGFERAWLFTPAGQVRARRFYERQGWVLHGEPFPDPKLGELPVVEYRLAL